MHEMYLAGTQNLSQYLQDQTSKEYKAITTVLNSYEFLTPGYAAKHSTMRCINGSVSPS